jgi:hypothetical protein
MSASSMPLFKAVCAAPLQKLCLRKELGLGCPRVLGRLRRVRIKEAFEKGAFAKRKRGEFEGCGSVANRERRACTRHVGRPVAATTISTPS